MFTSYTSMLLSRKKCVVLIILFQFKFVTNLVSYVQYYFLKLYYWTSHVSCGHPLTQTQTINFLWISVEVLCHYRTSLIYVCISHCAYVVGLGDRQAPFSNEIYILRKMFESTALLHCFQNFQYNVNFMVSAKWNSFAALKTSSKNRMREKSGLVYS
jgi:hypothetical protein